MSLWADVLAGRTSVRASLLTAGSAWNSKANGKRAGRRGVVWAFSVARENLSCAQRWPAAFSAGLYGFSRRSHEVQEFSSGVGVLPVRSQGVSLVPAGCFF